MNAGEITRYFKSLAKHYGKPCRVILTGASAGALLGRVRGTLDVDFEVELKKSSPRKTREAWEKFQAACSRASAETGIAAQYSEDIDRWSMISYLDHQKHTPLFRKFGPLKVRVLEPEYWAIGKLTRYLDQDVRDLVHVFKRRKVSGHGLAKLLGIALKQSPKSTACYLFRRQVEDFLKTYGREIWGKRYLFEETVRIFHQAAGIR